MRVEKEVREREGREREVVNGLLAFTKYDLNTAQNVCTMIKTNHLTYA